MTWTLLPATEFARYTDAWRAINRAGADTVLLDPDLWIELLSAFGRGHEQLALYGDSDPRAIALLSPGGSGKWQTFQPSQAPLGPWLAHPQLFWPDLLRDLIRALPRSCLTLGITQQDPDIAPRPESNGQCQSLDYIQTARISINGSFDDYWTQRGRNLRHNMKRQRNALAKQGINTRLEVLARAEDMSRAISLYGGLESSGWKTGTGTAIHPENEQGRFYQAMLMRLAKRNAARVYCYWYGDQIAAVDLCVHDAGTLVILKTTYDETQKSSSPALLMRHEYFQSIFDLREFRRIEFYGKLMDWHTKWTDEVRTMYHVNAYRSSVLARIHKMWRTIRLKGLSA